MPAEAAEIHSVLKKLLPAQAELAGYAASGGNLSLAEDCIDRLKQYLKAQASLSGGNPQPATDLLEEEFLPKGQAASLRRLVDVGLVAIPDGEFRSYLELFLELTSRIWRWHLRYLVTVYADAVSSETLDLHQLYITTTLFIAFLTRDNGAAFIQQVLPGDDTVVAFFEVPDVAYDAVRTAITLFRMTLPSIGFRVSMTYGELYVGVFATPAGDPVVDASRLGGKAREAPGLKMWELLVDRDVFDRLSDENQRHFSKAISIEVKHCRKVECYSTWL